MRWECCGDLSRSRAECRGGFGSVALSARSLSEEAGAEVAQVGILTCLPKRIRRIGWKVSGAKAVVVEPPQQGSNQVLSTVAVACNGIAARPKYVSTHADAAT